MAYGDGSITEVKKKDGTSYKPKKWRIRVVESIDPVTGKVKRRSRTIRGTKADARAVLKEMKEELELDQRLPVAVDGDVTFAEYSTEWHEERVATDAISNNRRTVEEYLLRGINACIVELRVRDVTPRMVRSCLAKIRSGKAKTGHRCSGTTLNMHYGILRQILEVATDDGLLARNPADKVKPPKIDMKEMRALSQVEGQRLSAVLDDAEMAGYERRNGITARKLSRGDDSSSSYLRGLSEIGRVMAARIALYTGMRRGEVLALTWGDVDLERGCIRVKSSLTPDGEVKEPKTKASRRRIKVEPSTIEHLRYWKRRQREELATLSLLQTNLTPVCCNGIGSYQRVDNFSHWWRSFAKGAGFAGLRFHELRHTHATQLVANGIDMVTVSHRLGHASVSITLSLYAHFVPENDDDAATLIGHLFSVPNGGRAEGAPSWEDRLRVAS